VTLATRERLPAPPGGAAPAWLAARRAAAVQRFTEVGFPTTRQEAWRFTDVGAIAQATFAPAPAVALTPGTIAPYTFGADEGLRLVFVNGHFDPSLSQAPALPARVAVLPLSAALALPEHARRIEQHLGTLADIAENPFVALNTGYASEGAYIFIPKRIDLAPTVHLLFVTAPGAAGSVSHPRNLVILEEGARVELVEQYVGLESGAYFVNPVTESVVGANAELVHYKVQREGLGAWHVGALVARQARDSRYYGFSAAVGASIGRTDIRTVFAGPGGESVLNGLYLVRGDQTIDHHTRIEHREPNCASRELYKGVLTGRGHGVFNGQVYVTPEAQKTDGKQTNRNLLLSDTAKVDTKPELEIFADDVKCTHGATVGRLDRMPLFYLESRGIGPALAARMLTFAFAAEVLADLSIPPVKSQLETLLGEWLG
jgi:Fe-S cluster assembly protein SufD